MSREIRFRVWDKPNRRLWSVSALDFHFNVALCSDSLTRDGIGPLARIPLGDCELMQFTGMHDKCGFGIYEGDILQMVGEANAKVYFSQGSFMAEEIGGWDPLTKYYPLSGNIEHSEIIGNIYENPELLVNL